MTTKQNSNLSFILGSALFVLCLNSFLPETHAASVVLTTIRRNLPNAYNLCEPETQVCTRYGLKQATAICGPSYVDKLVDFKTYTYQQVTSQRCFGDRCHLEVSTNGSLIHAGIDCILTPITGTTAACNCTVYRG
ncbi:hypothetical protein M8J76_001850 [Diaphorina citri]|nr:hypothetical protein M8J75_000878 [Diaphorina citri]KAI5718893.1 hypothetical protein M8J76_001850 [Diaphorina citri]KAI5720029.1 hypothetical protein M8J77_000824 [Diaphorina citri]